MLAMTYPKIEPNPFKITLKRTLRNTFSKKRHAKSYTIKNYKGLLNETKRQSK